MRNWSGAGAELATLFGAGAVGRLSDAELVARFVRRETTSSSEAAFAALVERHGPMVLGVCRRTLGDDHAAADAFQAVFLVLARKAPTIRVDDSLGRWLYGVSVRVARRARAVAQAERVRVRAMDGLDPAGGSPPEAPEDLRELRQAIDEEIARLPARHRSAVVLCYLEGLTQEQAARQLRCPVRTVESRLRLARERLRRSLSRRGVAPAGWCPALLTATIARPELPPAMARQAAAAPAGTVPAAAAHLARATMRSLFMARGLRIGWMLVALGLTATGTAIVASGQGTKSPVSPSPPARAGAPTGQLEPAPAAAGRLEIRVIADATGRPIEGAAVDWRLQVDQEKHKDTRGTTDADGRAALEWPRGSTVRLLEVTVRKSGFVPYFIAWTDRAHPLRLPALKELRFATGRAIGGVVKDEAGVPIAGARINVTARPNESEAANYGFALAEATTDAGGRWRVDDAPADLVGVSVHIRAPRFLQVGRPPSHNLDAVTVLKRGFTVRGRVLDAGRRPIAGASVRGGDEWTPQASQAKTDARGEFVLENCPPGASVVSVQAEGFAPDQREVHPEDDPALEFRLGPAHTLRGRVVDRQGKPLAGATLYPDTWRGQRLTLYSRIEAGPDGRFEWRGAPGDAVIYSVSRSGYISRRDVAMTPTGADQVITLDPELVISGRVTDAETGRPVPAFRLIRGIVFSDNPRVSWMTQDAATFAGGQYTARHGDSYAGYAVRIEAPGYKPAESRVLKPGEAEATVDFKLVRAVAADLLSGVVVRADGKPAAGAEVALATPDHPLVFETEQCRFGRGNGMSFARTGPDGRFSFDRPRGPYLVAAMSDDGYGEAEPDAMAKSDPLVLKPWGKIKGRARIGRQPAVNQAIAYSPRDPRHVRPGMVHRFDQLETRTDAQGNFQFDRVIPGAGEVSRVVVTELGNGMQQHMGCWQEPVEVAPGQTALVHLGARGRPVVGRVVVLAPPGLKLVDWRQNRPATIEKARHLNPMLDPRAFDRYAANLDKDGRFRIDDVPPGQYELTVTIDAPPASGQPAPTEELGRVKVSVDVPRGDDDMAVDLGEIKAEVKGR